MKTLVLAAAEPPAWGMAAAALLALALGIWMVFGHRLPKFRFPKPPEKFPKKPRRR
jgi:hypothetical protein